MGVGQFGKIRVGAIIQARTDSGRLPGKVLLNLPFEGENTIISQIIRGGKSVNLGNLSPTRDLTFVIDTCKGFLEIYKSDKLFGEIINIGMGLEISIENLIKKISLLVKAEVNIEKLTNGDDADTVPGPTIAVGDAVNWTYRVVNSGNVALTDVTITDDKIADQDISVALEMVSAWCLFQMFGEQYGVWTITHYT